MHRRAKFIWVPTQKIDHEAYFRLVAFEPLRRDDGVNKWVLFRKKFTMDETLKLANINITCDGRYQLFVNGKMAGRGPSRASPHFMRFDEIDISQHLKIGENVFAVLVHSPGVDLAWYETTKGSWQPVFGDGGLYVDLKLGDKDITSDTSWKCLETDAWSQSAPRTGWGQDFIEDFDARELPTNWKKLDFNDYDWPKAQELISEGTKADKATGRGAHEPFPSISRKEIPQLREQVCLPERIVWAQAVTPRPEDTIDQQLYNELTTAPPAGMFENAEHVISNDKQSAIIRTTSKKDASILLAFNPYITGFPYIEIEANGGEVIEVAAGEALPGEFDGTDPKAGLKRPNFLTFAHLFRYTAKPGLQQFEKFEFTAVRALQITVRNAPDGIKIRSVGVRAINYPAKFEGNFQCDDPVLNNLWNIGRHTALQCMHDAYEDCPGREKRQWVGDGVIHFDISEAAFGPSGYALGKQFFLHAAESQRADGLLHMFTPGDNRGDGVIIPDFTLHWILGVYKYWLTTGDEDLVEIVYPTIEKALAWFARHRDVHGLLANIPFWHFIEWADIGRSGEAGAINALYGGALQAAAKLGAIIENSRAVKRYIEMTNTVKRSLDARHWNKKRGAYVDEVDPETGIQGLRISQQTNALMIAYDLAPQEKWDRILKTITNKDALKFTAAPPIFVNAPPINEKTDIVRANTFYCHFLYEAFAKTGQFDCALEHMHMTYKPMLETGTTTLWESFEPSASLCHVFSAAPVYHLSRHILGVIAVDAKFAKICIAPQFGKLNHANGIYPTPLGKIEVQWERVERGVEYKIQMPSIIEYELLSPNNYSIQSKIEKESNGQHQVKIIFANLPC